MKLSKILSLTLIASSLCVVSANAATIEGSANADKIQGYNYNDTPPTKLDGVWLDDKPICNSPASPACDDKGVSRCKLQDGYSLSAPICPANLKGDPTLTSAVGTQCKDGQVVCKDAFIPSVCSNDSQPYCGGSWVIAKCAIENPNGGWDTPEANCINPFSKEPVPADIKPYCNTENLKITCKSSPK